MSVIEALIAQYGLIAVALGAVIEGETVVTVAGFAAHQGLLNPIWVAVCAILGAFAGDQLIFTLAHRFRDAGPIRRLSDSAAGRGAIGFVAARPTAFILGFRFMVGFRTVGPVAIALAGIGHRRFACLNLLSAVVWGILWTALGYLAGSAVETLMGKLERFEHRALVGLAIILLVGGFGWLLRHQILRRSAGTATV